MNKAVLAAIFASLLGSVPAGTALADTAETRGGVLIKSDDGRFEARIGGRIHFDAVSLDSDESPARYSDEGGAYFRRARLSLSGKAYGWEYKFENEFADTVAFDTGDDQPEEKAQSSFRDMHVATGLWGGKVTIGQFKPLRILEELTSSNEITMAERPFVSASGLFSGRQYGMGLKYEGGGDHWTWGLAAQTNSILKANDSRVTEEPVVTGRVTFAPVNTDLHTVHVGLSAGLESGDPATGATLRGRAKIPGTDLGSSRTLAQAGSATGATEGDAQHLGLELGGAFGPFYTQAEYVQASYTDALDGTGGPEDADVIAWYLMASFFVTGEHKPYRAGVFKSPAPAGDLGAIELKARYDHAENRDAPTSATVQNEISVLTVGANWYVNRAARFMLEYSMGEDNTSQENGRFREPTAVTLRTQFSF